MLFKIKVDKNAPIEEQNRVKDLIDLLDKDKENEQKLELFLLTYSTVIDSEYQMNDVKETKYKKMTFRDVIKRFDDPNFYKLPKSEIVALCSEVNQKIAQKLKIVPSVVAYKRPLINRDMVRMLCYSRKNEIVIFHTPKKDVSHGYGYLFDILHETYHSYQFQQLDKMRKGLSFDRACLIGRIQNCINEIKLHNSKKYLTPDEIKNLDTEIYCVDLLETEANLFAHRMLDKLYEKKYLTNEMPYNYNNSVSESYLKFQIYFRDDDFNRLKHDVKKNFKELSYVSKAYSKYFDAGTNYNMKSILSLVSQENIDYYLDSLYSDVSNVRINNRFKTKILENLNEREFYDFNERAGKNKLKVEYLPYEEIKGKYYLYSEKNLDLPNGKAFETEMEK